MLFGNRQISSSCSYASPGWIRPGDPLDQKQIDFACGVVSLCAGIADEYPNPSCPEDTVGDHIRAVLLEH